MHSFAFVSAGFFPIRLLLLVLQLLFLGTAVQFFFISNAYNCIKLSNEFCTLFAVFPFEKQHLPGRKEYIHVRCGSEWCYHPKSWRRNRHCKQQNEPIWIFESKHESWVRCKVAGRKNANWPTSTWNCNSKGCTISTAEQIRKTMEKHIHSQR